MDKQNKIEPLVNIELIRKVKELGNLSKAEKAKACGYYTITKNGNERVNMKQFLNALIDAQGIKLDGDRKADEPEKASVSNPTTAQRGKSMDSNKVISVIRAGEATEKNLPVSQPVQKPEIEPTQEIEVELPEQPEPVFHLESLAEPPRDSSVYGSGWSITELMNEFAGR